jgi:hypothetical protein
MKCLVLYIFQSHLLAPHIIMIYQAVSPTHNNDILPLKIITCSHCTFTQTTTQLSAGPTVSSQFLSVRCLLLSHQKQSSDNDCPHMIHSVSCRVSVTVCSLLLCPLFIDCFSVFHSVCLLLSQLYSQYFTFSTSSCSSSQSTLNTVTQL